jgi:hypothetical protein
MTSRRVSWALLVTAVACANAPKPAAKENREAVPAEEIDKQVKALAPRPAHQPEPRVPAVDPSRIAVEEDFAGEAAQRLTRRSNLELELQRLAKDIGSAPR